MSFFKRSAEQATSSQVFSAGLPKWSKWSIRKGVRDGYIASGWVYRAVNEIKQAASSVPWTVVNAAGEPMPDHHITQLLNSPNPSIPRQQFFEILISWLQIAGNGYAKRIYIGGKTKELWLMTPDKIAPIAGTGSGEWVKGFHRMGASGQVSEVISPEDMLHFLLPNPADPIVGISPLQAASRAVDTDVAQLDFNKCAMDNRGVLDGIFVFKDLAVSQWDAVREKVRDAFTGTHNARTPAVLSAEASYIKLGLTPAEMDFLASRKFNRDEILHIFGIPPQLVGAQESSTFNNFSASQRIFWQQTIIPLLVKIQSTLQLSLSNEMKDGERIVYDTSAVAALQDNLTERVMAASVLWDMGVPLGTLNGRFELGLDDVQDSDLPWAGYPPRANMAGAPSSVRSASLETRSNDSEWQAFDDKRKAWEDGKGSVIFAEMFRDQRDGVLKALANGDDPVAVIQAMRKDWMDKTRKLQVEVAKDFING